MTALDGLGYLRETMAILRGDDGCEWDRQQDHASLVPFLVEETAELIDAIDGGDRDEVVEELGDVLYQVFFHADILAGDDDSPVTIDDVARKTADKMRSRHPHVFEGLRVSGVEEIRRNWIATKRAERGGEKSVVDQVPRSLHPIARAQALIKRAERNGLGVTTPSAPVTAAEDIGDALLGLVATAEAQGIDADTALRRAISKLETRIVSEENGADGGHNR
jgi:XTP/dITP diphosphohydrolase